MMGERFLAPVARGVNESANLTTNFIWNLEASYLMTTTLPVFFQDLSQTASCAC